MERETVSVASSGNHVPARLAVSVILLRESSEGPVLFVQHRSATMDFAAGMVVFPGGRVDERDSSGLNFDGGLLSKHAAAWSVCSIGEPKAARTNAGILLAAAVREVMEECGIALEPVVLVPWANWVTPEDQPKRFDTYFYLATLPADIEPIHQTTEATSSQWTNARQIINDELHGSLRLLPPTLTIIDELLKSPEPAVPRTRNTKIVPVRPQPGDMEKFFRLRRRESAE
uniref:Nudix hydrolase domain-containing protein n=1 Tax=Arthrobacter sp. TM1 TaxID=75752 RepID=Q9LCU4_9MICC|nr:unknown [Arthrobacter sp. TM1]